MPHTDAISFAVTLGLLLIILKIVSVVSEGVSVVAGGVFVVVSVVTVEVFVVSLMLISCFRQVPILSGLLFSSTVGMLQPNLQRLIYIPLRNSPSAGALNVLSLISHRNIAFHSFASIKVFALRIRPYETLSTNHCLFRIGTFSTDIPFLTSSEAEGVRVISPALGHDKPLSVGCPLYNEASVFRDRLVVSSNVVQRLD